MQIGRRIVAIVRAGRISAFFEQRVGRPEFGDFGDEGAGFCFGNEPGFFGEEKDAFIDGRRDRPGKYDARDGLHCAHGGAYGGAFESRAFEDESMCKNVLFDSPGVASKKIRSAAIRLRNFLARHDDEDHTTGHTLGGLLKMLERRLSLGDRRRAAPPQEKDWLLCRTDDVLMLVYDLHKAHVTKVFALRKEFRQLALERVRLVHIPWSIVQRP